MFCIKLLLSTIDNSIFFKVIRVIDKIFHSCILFLELFFFLSELLCKQIILLRRLILRFY
jgi:hypothetical protein